MARKIYRINLSRNYARLIIKGETGNEVIYEFKDGNPVNSTPAKCIISGEYEQELLEGSEYFKNRTVTLEKVIETDDDKVRKAEDAARKARLAGMVKVDDVKSVTEAIAYCVEHFGEKATSARHALQIAEENGVTFPNLKLGKK